MHVFLLYFAWPAGAAWGNVWAMPLCGLVAVAFAVCLRKPLAHWWKRHFGMKAELAEIRELAAKAHRIAADTYRHETGEHHPDAPKERHR